MRHHHCLLRHFPPSPAASSLLPPPPSLHRSMSLATSMHHPRSLPAALAAQTTVQQSRLPSPLRSAEPLSILKASSLLTAQPQETATSSLPAPCASQIPGALA